MCDEGTDQRARYGGRHLHSASVSARHIPQTDRQYIHKILSILCALCGIGRIDLSVDFLVDGQRHLRCDGTAVAMLLAYFEKSLVVVAVAAIIVVYCSELSSDDFKGYIKYFSGRKKSGLL